MASSDRTRVGDFHQKKSESTTVVRINAEVFKDFNIAGDYVVAHLPPRAVVTNAYIHTLEASDSGAVTLGTTEGGTEILSVGDTTSTGESGTATGQVSTGTGVSLYMGIAAPVTEGDFLVVVEYLEYTKNTGEYTNIS